MDAYTPKCYLIKLVGLLILQNFLNCFSILVLLCQVHGQGDLWVKLPSYGNNNHLVIHSNLCMTTLSCMSLDKATSR